MPELHKVRYTHDAVIDEILMNPAISQGDLSRMFGYTQAWMSICINSDAFKERLAERKGELKDPIIRATIQDRVTAAAGRALDRLLDRLDGVNHGAIKTADLVAIARLDVAPKALAPTQTQNLYVVALPPPAANSQAWLDAASGRQKFLQPLVIENDA